MSALKQEVAVKVDERVKVKEIPNPENEPETVPEIIQKTISEDVCDLPKPIFVISDCTGII